MDLFPPPLVLFDVIMTFLALLELLRQHKLEAKQIGALAPIHVHLSAPDLAPSIADSIRYSSGVGAGS
jgi:chromatin segregation and condensation protein Rec8/ScpA/Scc1 (kleisin family)